MRYAAALFVLASSLAHAQEPTAEVRAEMVRIHGEAGAHAEAGRHALAAERYLDLHELMRREGLPRAPVPLWDAGLELMQLPERARDARDLLQRFLDESTALASETDVAEWRSSAIARIAELDARIRAGGNDREGDRRGAPPRSAGGPHPVGPITLGVGILAIAVGAVFGAVALVMDNELWDSCGGMVACLDTPEHRSAYDETRLFAGVTDVLLVAGGIIAITGLVLTFTLTEGAADESGRERPSADVRLGPGQFFVTGRF
jgi:hypothetical protein